MTTTTPSAIESISQETVDFVKRELYTQASSRGFMIMPWSIPIPLAATLHDVLILKERCNLEYPLLEHSCHFNSGVRLTIEVGPEMTSIVDGASTQRNVFLYLRSIMEQDQSEEPDSARGVIDLTNCQNHLQPGGMSGIPAFAIQQAFLTAVTEDERRLNRFRRPTK